MQFMADTIPQGHTHSLGGVSLNYLEFRRGGYVIRAAGVGAPRFPPPIEAIGAAMTRGTMALAS